MAKLDLKDAYRIVPVHPHDRPLIGMRWRDSIYMDMALPFGLRSAPKIFSALADGLIWIMHNMGADPSIHYLDGFLLLGPPSSLACKEALHTTLKLCGEPVAEEKTEGPVTALTFLGIIIDSETSQLRLPLDKLQELRRRLRYWRRSRRSSRPRRSGRKRDLLSLIGLLNHAATVVKPGRTFLHSLIDASMTVDSLDHYVHLNARARADVTWWYTFAQSWNGSSLLPASQFVYSDASGSWGCGATWNNQWFRVPWSAPWSAVHIAPKELAPIIIAAAVWWASWAGQRVCCYSDNSAVVYAINKGTARDPELMRLLRTLFFFCASYDVTISARQLTRCPAITCPCSSLSTLRHRPSLHPFQLRCGN